MSGALAGLVLASARGRLRKLVRQLRRPRQAIATAVGLAWMLLWVGRWLRGTHAGAYAFADWRGQALQAAGGGAGVLLAIAFGVALTVAWIVPFGGLGLPLKESELHVLLPAPLRRRDLIRFALLKAQPPLLISVVLLSLFGGSGRPLDQVRTFVALWIAMTAWDLLMKARGLFLVRQREIPRRGAALRRGALSVAIVAWWVALAVALRPYADAAASALRGTADAPGAILGIVERLGADVALAALLAPARAVTAALVAPGGLGWALAAAVGVGAIVVVEELTVRSRARFEETALARAASTSDLPNRRFRRMSAGARRRLPFDLRPAGEPALAVLWKNLARVARVPLRRVVAGLVIALAVAAIAVAWDGDRAGVVVAAIGGVLVFWAPFGSVALRNDLRSDLMHLEALRTWPVRGDRLMLAEILSPTVFGGIAGTFGAALLALSAIVGGSTPELLGTRGALAVVLGVAGGLPVLWGVAALASAILNLGAVAFPSWFPLGPAATRGLAATGQRLVVGFALFFGQLFGLLPGVLLVGLAALAQWLLGIPWTAWALPVWGLLAALPLAIEVVLVSRVAGRVWARLDPSQEVLETGR